MNKEEYFKALFVDIEILKGKGRHSLYRMNDPIADDIVEDLKQYFENDKDYEFNIRKCTLYPGTWDLMISF